MRIVFNVDGFEEIRRSPKVAGEVNRIARDMAQQAGRGFEWSGQQGKKGPVPPWNKRKGPGWQGRYRAIVYPATHRAMYVNGRDNTLVKLVGRGWDS